MAPTSVWGPPIWTFFHVLTCKIKEEKFNETFPMLYSYIRRICRILPCPDCSSHATQFLNKINPNTIKTKQDFKNFVYIFHNAVNRRKNKPLFNHSNLSQYDNHSVIKSFNNFLKVYHTKGNMHMLTESFQRELVIKDFRKWFVQNINGFQVEATNSPFL